MAQDIEKHHVDRLDHVDYAAKDSDSDAQYTEFTPAEQKKIIHRIDRRLVTTVGAMYCVSLIDRTNLGVAAIAG